jgi:hypothetical protein
MGQTREEVAQNLAERLCWQAARRDDSRVARRLYRKQVVDGVYRLDEGALLDDFLVVGQFHVNTRASARLIDHDPYVNSKLPHYLTSTHAPRSLLYAL